MTSIPDESRKPCSNFHAPIKSWRYLHPSFEYNGAAEENAANKNIKLLILVPVIEFARVTLSGRQIIYTHFRFNYILRETIAAQRRGKQHN